MSVSVFSKHMLAASGAASLMLLSGLGGPAQAQTPATGSGTTVLPNIVVEAPKQVAGTPKQRPKPRLAARRAVSPPSAPTAPVSPAAQLAAKSSVFDQARSN